MTSLWQLELDVEALRIRAVSADCECAGRPRKTLARPRSLAKLRAAVERLSKENESDFIIPADLRVDWLHRIAQYESKSK